MTEEATAEPFEVVGEDEEDPGGGEREQRERHRGGGVDPDRRSGAQAEYGERDQGAIGQLRAQRPEARRSSSSAWAATPTARKNATSAATRRVGCSTGAIAAPIAT